MAPVTTAIKLIAIAAAGAKTVKAFEIFGQQINAFGTVDDCILAEDLVSSCSNVVPTGSTDDVWAECLCCSGSSWDPSVFDGPVSECYDYLTDNVPKSTSIISQYGNIAGICSSVGSVPCGGATATGSLTVTADGATGTAACLSATSVISSCATEVTDWADADATGMAGCLCYMDEDWSPDRLDGYLAGCRDWAKTEDPALYSTMSGLAGFCSSIGDVGAYVVTATAAAAQETSSTTRTGGGNGIGLTGVATTAAASSTVVVIETPTPTDNAAAAGGVANSGLAALLTFIFGLYAMA